MIQSYTNVSYATCKEGQVSQQSALMFHLKERIGMLFQLVTILWCNEFLLIFHFNILLSSSV